ncbi:penicillin-binding transpeptidase domain-containing protein [Clostridium vincentii]|uniref:Peptidoglycan synthase FtsI n=1 Tax=Clostridium vincentii TaxID=52704 RepID=A0A2T0BEW3_9CLOT|nr:penicillin-binding transpeptidase domain-containing protein [Clostridium vincentii]PRR82441.1 Peptidoglycan synthase FtsI precursor [Clostridium vincentii]
MIVSREKKKKKPSRYTTFIVIMSLIFTIMIIKLIYIQIYKHEDYQDQANTTATKFISEKAPRGIIYDQNGNILATNTQTYAMTYTSTTEADTAFYKTVDGFLEILAQTGESVQDELILQLNDKNEPYLNFKGTTSSAQEAEEIRFKRDRGLNEDIEEELYGTDIEDLSDTQISAVNEELLKISSKDVFYYLVKSYDLISLINPEPTEENSTEYEEKLKEYKAKVKQYDAMTDEEITSILAETYSYSQLRNYMMIKDAIKMQSFKGFKSVTLAKNIEENTAFIIYQKLNDLPGIDVTREPTRTYPYGVLASSAIGYISSIDKTNEELYDLRGYDASTDLIGVAGIESAFEDQLKGVKGGTTVKVNSKGRVTETLFELESYPGSNVHLTIDKNVQYAAEQALADTMAEIRTNSDGGNTFSGANRGAVVAVEVNTGRVLASVSYPNYDPNIFAVSGQLTTAQNQQYFSPDLDTFGTNLINSKGLNKTVDELFPMSDGIRTDPNDLYPRSFYNYATQGFVQPGSTFKPMTALAGIESGAIDATTTIEDKGIFNEHSDVFGKDFGPKCWIYAQSHGNHGTIGVEKALEVSCNYYFYEVAFRLYQQAGSSTEALDSLAKYAWRFGLGTDPDGEQKPSTGIEIEENFGQVYNFKSFKNKSIVYAKFEIRDFLEAGVYNNGTNFVPVDYSDSEDDSENLKEAKTALKAKITDRFNAIGIGDEESNPDEYAKIILDDVKKILELSPKYEENVKSYESSGKGTVDIDAQAKIVARVIATYVTSDKRTEILSPAQEVYAAIGQSINAFTPMQLAQYISTLSNGGTRYKLHYVDKVTDPDGELIKEYIPEVLDKIEIKDSTLQAIKNGMSKVNNDEDGTASTAWDGFPTSIQTAGKTGTADFGDGEKQYEVGRAPFATYISFAPVDNPEIAVVTVVYDGGHGGYVAPVARAVYEAYFKERILQSDPNYASKSPSFQKYVVGVKPDNKINK